MSSTSAKLLGICLGLALGMIALSRTNGHSDAGPRTGPMLSECDGAIRSIVIQYVAGADFAANIYRQLIPALPGDVRIYAVCPGPGDWDELSAALGNSSKRLTPIFTRHEMTAWSRDRWIALSPLDGQGPTTLAAPWAEAGAGIWLQRRGDQRIASDLAARLTPAVGFEQTGLYFDGGDLLADERSVFVTPGLIRRNLQQTARTRQELEQMIESVTHRHAILLEDAPDHHAGMFMMAAGDNRVVVGDPSLARPLLEPIDLPGGADFSMETQRQFDSVADAASAAGYRVTRIPCVSAADGKTYITPLNGIIDQRDGVRTIYLPQYEHQDRFNAAARGTWESLGFRVVPIDVTGTFRYFGTLHCLVNVLEKS